MTELKTLEPLVALCKRRGFIFPGSDIYGGLANTWDYGPYGILLKTNLKNLWWKHFIEEREDMVGLDAAILMNPRTWEASGHVENFNDPLLDCKKCKKRSRGDKLLEEKIGVEEATRIPLEEIALTLENKKITCPYCGECSWAEAKQFNLMFKTHQGVTEDTGTEVYLRPETAQGIFVNFKNVLDSCRVKIPFGIGQIGKAFRNEITPGNFTFRTREFEQMEIEYFVTEEEKPKKFDEWKNQCEEFFEKTIGIKKENIRTREHESDELSHYSSRTLDIEYNFPWGWGELMGLADRGNFDLTQHEKFSGQNLKVHEEGIDPYLPHVIEPSFGCDRTVLTILTDAYHEEEMEDGKTRTVMKFHPSVAPVKVAVFPLLKNKPDLIKKAREVYDLLRPHFDTEWDDNGNIGKRYRRQDEIGTPFCVTIDFDTLGEGDNADDADTVTIRDRDMLDQHRIKISELEKFLRNKIYIS